MKLWREAEHRRQWFALAVAAAANYEGGFFPRELEEYWFSQGAKFDGRELSPTSPEDHDALTRALESELQLFIRWRLFSQKLVPPRDGMYTKNLKFKLFDEPQSRPTRVGARLVSAGTGVQRTIFACLLGWEYTGRIRRSLKVAAGVLAPTFSVLKFVAKWETEKAAVAGVVAAVAGALVTPRK